MLQKEKVIFEDSATICHLLIRKMTSNKLSLMFIYT